MVAGAALIVPVGFLVVTAITVGIGAGMHVGWAMNNDAAWNTVSSRLILSDGGIAHGARRTHRMANGLMALWYAPGRPEAGVLRHDVERQTEFLLLMTALASTVAGVLTARGGVGRRAVVIAVGAVIGGLIPLSWFLSGYVIQFGFFNVVPVIAVMLACWMLWSESIRRPVVATTGLLLGTMVLFRFMGARRGAAGCARADRRGQWLDPRGEVDPVTHVGGWCRGAARWLRRARDATRPPAKRTRARREWSCARQHVHRIPHSGRHRGRHRGHGRVRAQSPP